MGPDNIQGLALDIYEAAYDLVRSTQEASPDGVIREHFSELVARTKVFHDIAFPSEPVVVD